MNGKFDVVACRALRALVARRPGNARELQVWVRCVLGLDVPDTPVVPGSGAPLAYLAHTFFECGRDAVVWAPRGGGKTMLGAAATVLDLLFKPGVQVRILGGSLEQSSRMYEYVLALLDRPGLRGLLAGDPTQRCVRTHLGGRASILAQSQRSVRGVRVHKLRCDEVELFDPEVWDAAQLVTRSSACGRQMVHGTIEALSTMHVPGGLMSRLVESCAEGGSCKGNGLLPSATDEASRQEPARPRGAGANMAFGPGSRDPSAVRRHPSAVFRWTALDVIERCPPQRDCGTCVLWNDCRGRAKSAAGFVPVDDLVRQWRRSSHATWAAEMMCQRPAVRDAVYAEFDPTRHVQEKISINLLKLTDLHDGSSFAQ